MLMKGKGNLQCDWQYSFTCIGTTISTIENELCKYIFIFLNKEAVFCYKETYIEELIYYLHKLEVIILNDHVNMNCVHSL